MRKIIISMMALTSISAFAVERPDYCKINVSNSKLELNTGNADIGNFNVVRAKEKLITKLYSKGYELSQTEGVNLSMRYSWCFAGKATIKAKFSLDDSFGIRDIITVESSKGYGCNGAVPNTNKQKKHLEQAYTKMLSNLPSCL